MSISGISGGFSANSLIAASRVRARPGVQAPPEVDGVEPPVIEFLPPEGTPPTPPENLLPPIGPGLGELTPRPGGERPFGLFRNESRRNQSDGGNESSARGSEQNPGDEIQDLVNQIIGKPNDSGDDRHDGSDAREGAPELGAAIQDVVNRIVDEPEGRPEEDQEPRAGESPIPQDPQEVVNNLVRGNENSGDDKKEGEGDEKSEERESRPDEPRAAGEELSETDQKEVQRLQKRDAEVVAHENAHKAAAGGLANGAIHYDTEKGPDGRTYRTGGHVNINTSKGKTPEETIQRATIIKRAALAPAEPSSQDRAVANKASQMESEARQELAEQRLEEARERAEEAKENQGGTNSNGPELPRGAKIVDGNEDKDEPEIRIAGQEDEDEKETEGVGAQADQAGPAEKRAKEAEEPKTIEDAIDNALKRAGQTPASEKAQPDEKSAVGNGFQIPAFQINKALNGYQAAINQAQLTPAGSLFRLSI